MKLLEPETVANQIKDWILYIKEEFQIYDYEYSNNFYIGVDDNNTKIFLSVTTIPPKPTLEYQVDISNTTIKIFLSKIIELTKLI